MRTAVCEVCGDEFPLPPHVKPRRFCLTCAPDLAAYRRLYRRDRRERLGLNARGRRLTEVVQIEAVETPGGWLCIGCWEFYGTGIAKHEAVCLTREVA